MDELRESRNIKDSYEVYLNQRGSKSLQKSQNYVEYLMAIKRARRLTSVVPKEIISPRARYRNMSSTRSNKNKESHDMHEAILISTIASMVPDEIVHNHRDNAIRSYETALMFIDVSGFTELCEKYTTAGSGGPSKLTQVLNSYIGAMVQEILTHNGDVLKFSGDAFLSMWKKTKSLTMQDVVHTAIDCGLLIQKNYGTHVTDSGIILKVKVAISAGLSHFAIIGDGSVATYVIVGEPVWDVKAAEYMSTAGDVLTTASVWAYVNEDDYFTHPMGDGQHTKVLGIGLTWRRVCRSFSKEERTSPQASLRDIQESFFKTNPGKSERVSAKYASVFQDNPEINYREFTLRPAMLSALYSTWGPDLRRFMLSPVLRAVDNDEPMDYLTEVRHVVVVVVNIITKTVTENVLMGIVDSFYKQVCSMASESGGLVNKVNMFDKDMMFLVVFGLRGLKQEGEAQKALLCAFQLKQILEDPNVTSIAIGVTSGTTYCGVVGHVLRREYTVIGPAVNKAARLIMAYPNKVTCDKETFVRSKLDLDMFRLMEPMQMKGIAKPGPIYEFNKNGYKEHAISLRNPILGRTEEIRKFKYLLHNALDHQHDTYTKFEDQQYGIILTGVKLVGKKRLMDEFLNVTPVYLHGDRIILTPKALTEPFMFARILLERTFLGLGRNSRTTNFRDTVESRLRYRLASIELNPLQIHAVNTIFNVRFPLPDNFSYTGDILTEPSVKRFVSQLFKTRFQYMQVVGVRGGDFIDDLSWRLLLLLLDTKFLFIIIVINDYDKISDIAKNCVANNVFVKMNVQGIARWYHAALACQMLDVQAIPADLEKVMESASGGLPGWIQNFMISLLQQGVLSVVTVTRNEALEAGAVMPSANMLQKADDDASRDFESLMSTISFPVSGLDKQSMGYNESDTIQMAVLAENYNFGDMTLDMTMDVIILKTYDNLSPFEKVVLKCASVLGEVFSRRMLLYLLQSDSPRKVAQAHCRDLPSYAFCGYMKFRHEIFRITTYELLTENQKLEMHSRALLFLERYTRRCASCGAGCFTMLFGVGCDDGLIKENKQVKQVRQKIAAVSAETRMTNEVSSYFNSFPAGTDLPDYLDLEAKAENRRLSHSAKSYRKIKHVRSFSSLELENCECYSILLTVYCQILDHCRAVGQCEKLFDTYLEYADLSLLGQNIPQAIRLLTDAEETFVLKPESTNCHSDICKVSWMKDFRQARILTLRGSCMLESGDYKEARQLLLRAMKLFGVPFPTSKLKVACYNTGKSFHHFMALYVCPSFYIETESGWVGRFYDNIARALNKLFRLFMATKEFSNACLAAKWALQMTTKSNATFRLLCVAYANIITVHRLKQQFSMCQALERRAMAVCHRKRGQLDITEVNAVCTLYVSIFLFYVDYGKKIESLEFGLSVFPMITSLPDITTGQMLVLWMLKLLLLDLRLHDMILIMREFFYVTDYYDLSSETWYYFYAIVIILDTGYCVESYETCEQFYMRKGDAILRSKTPEAAWNFFVCMWLMTVRKGEWENSIPWEDKIKEIMKQKLQQSEFNMMIFTRLVEGLLITLVKEIENRNIKKVLLIEKNVKGIFKYFEQNCPYIFRPRYYLLNAYFNYVRGKRETAYSLLTKAHDKAKQYGNHALLIWIEHTQKYWAGILHPAYVNYWTKHTEAGNLLDYTEFDPVNGTIIPYTLPLPRDPDK